MSLFTFVQHTISPDILHLQNYSNILHVKSTPLCWRNPINNVYYLKPRYTSRYTSFSVCLSVCLSVSLSLSLFLSLYDDDDDDDDDGAGRSMTLWSGVKQDLTVVDIMTENRIEWRWICFALRSIMTHKNKEVSRTYQEISFTTLPTTLPGGWSSVTVNSYEARSNTGTLSLLSMTFTVTFSDPDLTGSPPSYATTTIW